MKRVEAEILGRKYTLQHPGHTAATDILQSCNTYDQSGRMKFDGMKLVIWCFEHVVLPKRGQKLDYDTYPGKTKELMGVWQPLLLMFLGEGDLPEDDEDGQWRRCGKDSADADADADTGESEDQSENSDSSGGSGAAKSGKSISGRVPRGNRSRRGNSASA